MNLVPGWNALMDRLPADLLMVATLAGVGVIAWSITSYLWANRNGGGGRKFSWAMLMIGLFLAGPRAVMPIALSIVEVVADIAIKAITGG